MVRRGRVANRSSERPPLRQKNYLKPRINPNQSKNQRITSKEAVRWSDASRRSFHSSGDIEKSFLEEGDTISFFFFKNISDGCFWMP